MESRFSSMPFDHGEGVSAAAKYGESVHRPKLRARRSAAARREQQRRSEARHFVRLLQGLQSIERHRGNELSPLGHSLLNAMRDTTRRDSAMPYRGDAHQSPTTYSICRHYMANRCTWGDRCRFRHEEIYNRDNPEQDDWNDNGNDNDSNINDGDPPQHQEDNHDNDNNDSLDYNTQQNNRNGDKLNAEGDDATESISTPNVLDDEGRQHAIPRLTPSLYFDVVKRLTTTPQQYDRPSSEEVIDLSDDDDVQQSDDDENESDELPGLWNPETGTIDTSRVRLQPLYDPNQVMLKAATNLQPQDSSSRSNCNDSCYHSRYGENSPLAPLIGPHTGAKADTPIESDDEVYVNAYDDVPSANQYAKGDISGGSGPIDSNSMHEDSFDFIIGSLAELPDEQRRTALITMPPLACVSMDLVQQCLLQKYGINPLQLDLEPN